MNSAVEEQPLLVNSSELCNTLLATVDGQSLLSPVIDYMTVSLLVTLFVSGLAGSTLTLVVICKKSLPTQASFRNFMVSITMAEMAYNLICIPRVYILLVKGLQTPHLWVLYAFKSTTFIVRISSFFSDISTTFLAFERYISLKAPLYWHSKSIMWKSQFSIWAIAVTATVSLVRAFMDFHSTITSCGFGNDTPSSSSSSSSVDQHHAIIYTFIDSPFSSTATFRTLAILVSAPLPIFIILFITYFNIHGFVLMRRLNARIADRARAIATLANVPKGSRGNGRDNGVNGGISNSEVNNMWLISMLSSCSTAICQVGYTYSTVVFLCGVDYPSPHLSDAIMSDISSSMNPKFYNKYLWFWIVSEAISRTNLFFLYVAFSRHFRNAVKLILKSTFPVAWRPTMRCPFQMQSCRIPSQLHGPAMRQLTPARILKLSNRKENGRFGGDATLTKHMWISFETRNS